jgi:hypothetical protein
MAMVKILTAITGGLEGHLKAESVRGWRKVGL